MCLKPCQRKEVWIGEFREVVLEPIYVGSLAQVLAYLEAVERQPHLRVNAFQIAPMEVRPGEAQGEHLSFWAQVATFAAPDEAPAGQFSSGQRIKGLGGRGLP